VVGESSVSLFLSEVVLMGRFGPQVEQTYRMASRSTPQFEQSVTISSGGPGTGKCGISRSKSGKPSSPLGTESGSISVVSLCMR
jgi:hypothetical protein